MKTYNKIVSFIIKNQKYVLWIWNGALQILKVLQTLPPISPSISVSLLPQEKKSGDENNKEKDHQVNPKNKNQYNKRSEGNQ